MMYHNYSQGWIEVITGGMFAGKTEELIRRVQVLSYTNASILVFKPSIDNRYSDEYVVSHSGSKVLSINIKESKEILQYYKPDVQIIAIDEVQFFDLEIVEICEYLANQGCRVICAGLDLDFRAEAFEVMSQLMPKAEFITKLTAICVICSSAATRSQRLVNEEPAKYDDPIILIGAKESYEARCRKHHQVVGRPSILFEE